MAGSPSWKVYTADKEYVASCKYPEHGAAIVTNLGDGSTIRYGHKHIVWTEGKEIIPAGESFDEVAKVCFSRIPDYFKQLKESMK